MRRRLLISLVMVVAGAMVAMGANRALVIGIGKQQDPAWGKINGDRDVPMVVKTLGRMGYKDIRTLVNEQATKKGIVGAIRKLTSDSRPGDKVYIHYSGHGQLVTDIDGDEYDKWSGSHRNWDESWVPYDAWMEYCEKDRGEKHLIDDELSDLLSALRRRVGNKGEIIVVIDSCHSGDATSAPSPDGSEPEAVRGIGMKFNIPSKPGAKPKRKAGEEQWLTVSACRPYQLSTEIGSLKVGKLTYAIYSLGPKALEGSPEQIEKRLNDFISQYKTRLNQTPMVSGKK